MGALIRLSAALAAVLALPLARPAAAAGGGAPHGNLCCETGPDRGLGPQGDNPYALSRDYLDELWRARPTLATAMGVHDHDRALESFSPAALRARQESLEGTLSRLAWFGRRPPETGWDIDLALLHGRVRAELAEMTQDRIHQRQPGLYVRLAGGAVAGLLRRPFAPLCERLRRAAARAAQVPRLLGEARQNLRDPPYIWTERAIAEMDEAVRFYDEEVPRAAVPCAEAEVQAALRPAAQAAAAALRAYQTYLRGDLRQRSNGAFALGPARLRQLLQDEELIDVGLGRLLSTARREVEDLRWQLSLEARKHYPSLEPGEALRRASGLFPPPAAGLLPAVQARLQEVRRFVSARKLVPLPPGGDLRVEEAPRLDRGAYLAVAPPGPLEEQGRDAFLYVMPVEPEWPPAQKEEHLLVFERLALSTALIHEAYPGHYVQGLYADKTPGPLRKVLSSTAYREGWAIYCERMLFDAGFAPDPRARLLMIFSALRHAVSAVAALELHTGRGSLPDATRQLTDVALLEPAAAERAAVSLTLYPLAIVHPYGAAVIAGLRRQAERQQGRRFRLGEFHRRLLSEGPIPVGMLGAALGLVEVQKGPLPNDRF